VAGNLADFDVLVRREPQRRSPVFAPRNGVCAGLLVVPHLDEEVQDLLGLSRVAEHLFA